MRYTVLLDPNPHSGVYTVTVPALPGCVTEGETIEAAAANAREAIAGYLEALARLGEPVPVDDSGIVVLNVEVETENLAPA